MGWGITLIVLAIGALALPLTGLQFKLVKLAESLGGSQPALSIVLLVAGVILVVKALRE